MTPKRELDAITEKWDGWDAEAQQVAQHVEDPDSWWDEMQASMWPVVKAAVEKASGDRSADVG